MPALRHIFARRAPAAPVQPPVAPADPAWHRTYPTLRAEHFAPNAGVYFDRSDMLLRLAPQKGLVIGEVGVGLGHFTRFLLDHMQPSCFVAFDLFNLHTMPDVWGRAPEQAFEGRTHRAHYEHIFAHHQQRMVIEEGESAARLATYAPEFFDILYIDADHRYEGVARDAAAAVPLMKPHGLLVFNDYMMCDHLGQAPFGVVPAVHELITTSDWKVVGFSLQPKMYCDIALGRK